MAKRVMYKGSGCVGCRLCAAVCAFRRFRSFNPRHGRIIIIKREPDVDIPVICLQCDKPRCVDACPAGAIILKTLGEGEESRSRTSSSSNCNSVSMVDEAKCTGCGTCVEACAIGAIHIHPETNKAIKCDLCYEHERSGSGEVEEYACIEFCPVKVLEVVGS